MKLLTWAPTNEQIDSISAWASALGLFGDLFLKACAILGGCYWTIKIASGLARYFHIEVWL